MSNERIPEMEYTANTGPKSRLRVRTGTDEERTIRPLDRLRNEERKQAKAYLKQNGEKTLNIQVLASRTRSYLPQIKADLELLEKLLETYERTKKG